MSDTLSGLRQRYQAALQRFADELGLPQSSVTKILGDLDHASNRIVNLRGVFACKRINEAFDEITAISREYDALCGMSSPAGRQSVFHTRLLV